LVHHGIKIFDFLIFYNLAGMKKLLLLAFLSFALSAAPALAQQAPFEVEVRQLVARMDSIGWRAGGTVVTGSSTIKFWSSLPGLAPTQKLINTGFGGSKAADLERYLYPLVIQFEPKRVFIYEGDNDLWAGLATEEILGSLRQIVNRIHIVDPSIAIYLIGAKPSPSRWEKKEAYLAFNRQLAAFCATKEGLHYISTWEALTDKEGNPRPELYLKDQLHLNAEGYQLWNGLFGPYFSN
jgi:lysophospholipase L1-like esterase